MLIRVAHRSAGTAGERAGARTAFALTAFVAWAGVVMTLLVSATGAGVERVPEPYLYGIHPAGAAGALSRVVDTLSYFTFWSNAVVGLSATLLLVRPHLDTFAVRALRLSALLMITVTAIVYAVILAPTDVVAGWSRITNPLQHIVTPAVTVGAWLVWGPRRWFTWRTVPAALVIPVTWIAWMLLRGLFIEAYPYGFANVAVLGYGAVAVNLLFVVAFGLAIAALYLAVDRALAAIGGRSARARHDARPPDRHHDVRHG